MTTATKLALIALASFIVAGLGIAPRGAAALVAVVALTASITAAITERRSRFTPADAALIEGTVAEALAEIRHIDQARKTIEANGRALGHHSCPVCGADLNPRR